MPFHWTGIGSSTPHGRRDDVRKTCDKPEYKGAKLVADHVFRDESGNFHVLVRLPDDAAKHAAFLAEIQAKEGGIKLVDTDGN